MFSEINYLAVGVSGLVYFVIGGLWYAAIFSNAYQKALAFDGAQQEEAKKSFPMALLTHFISGLVTSFVLAGAVHAMHAETFFQGVHGGLLLWFGFILTTNLNYHMFEKRPASLFLINSGFFLVAFAVVGGIVAVWR